MSIGSGEVHIEAMVMEVLSNDYNSWQADNPPKDLLVSKRNEDPDLPERVVIIGTLIQDEEAEAEA